MLYNDESMRDTIPKSLSFMLTALPLVIASPVAVSLYSRSYLTSFLLENGFQNAKHILESIWALQTTTISTSTKPPGRPSSWSSASTHTSYLDRWRSRRCHYSWISPIYPDWSATTKLAPTSRRCPTIWGSTPLNPSSDNNRGRL